MFPSSTCQTRLLLLATLALLLLLPTATAENHLRRQLQQGDSCHGTNYVCSFYYNDGGSCSDISGCSWSFAGECSESGCCQGVAKQCDEMSSETPCLAQGCKWGPAPPNCFSGGMVVPMLGNGMKAMKDLQVGDWVWTGKSRYQPIYAFGHYDPGETVEFLQIHVKAGDSSDSQQHQQNDNVSIMEITGDHLIYVQGKKYPVPAATVQLGDSLWSQATEKPAPVIAITTAQKQGIYAPLTADGTIVVGQGWILASTYTTLQDRHDDDDDSGMYATFRTTNGLLSSLLLPKVSHHDIAHTCVAPFRIFCLVWGRGSQWCHPNNNNDGMPTFVRKAFQWARWLDTQSMMVQITTWALFQVFRVIVVPLESVILAATTITIHSSGNDKAFWVTAVVLVATAIWILLRYKINFRLGFHKAN
ncbi:Intercellular signal essential for a variety of patterning events during development (By similarity) [Seminavis robusta]|uniref:Intercellular signal essential for a variety of patterning events during development By similarity n=1 Tax=Seminavis robusta TaxID=568900 RepID=A0A9N8EKQ0_9STRA|nr:Intercellular signal essential for a variety of patterning events during development (By similarity) [Seminavis robusta]|eukprot:Sro1349_g265130.1 Intercellular signal essential for a variety of patterning events during development (By similarity) (417) ;mRNA; r:29138-30388